MRWNFGQLLLSSAGSSASRTRTGPPRQPAPPLTRLSERPIEPTAHLTPVVQATRHNIWRIRHPHQDGYAVRLLLWFPDDNDGEIVIVFAGNKHPNHDHWYDRAIRETEAAVDQLIRQRPTSQKEQP
jgi:hypothetical protein